VVEVPEEFENNISINIGFKESLNFPVISYGTYPYRAQSALPKTGLFKIEIEGISSRDQIAGADITLYIDAPNHTNKTADQYGYEVLWYIDSGYDSRIEVTDYSNEMKKSNKFYDISQIFQW